MESTVVRGSQALFWDKFLYTGCILAAPLYLHFSFVITRREKYKFFIPFSYITGAMWLFFNYSNPLRKYFIADVIHRYTFRYIAVPGPLWFLYMFWFNFTTLIMFYNLYSNYKQSKGQEQTKAKYLLVAFLIMITAGCIYFALHLNIVAPPIDSYLLIIYGSIMTYAIVRHQLMEIEIVIKKTLVYSLLIFTITLIYFILVYLLEKFFSIIVGYRSIPLAIAIIALFSIIFTPLKNKIQRYIDKLFYKGSIDQIDKEKHLLETELQLSERLKTVSTLAAGMAHEIKNPLTSIKTFVEYMNEKYQDPEYRAKFNRIIPKEIDRITNIINQLLDYSKTDRISLKNHDMHHILNYVLDLYNNELLRKHITLKKTYSAQYPNITCDENQIKQAFINIILNSIEAMPDGGQLTVETKDKDNTLQISIQDTGPGIPKDKLEHLFDPFYTTKEKGTGLGLFIGHQIIASNNGNIIIESPTGKGTVVTIVFKKS